MNVLLASKTMYPTYEEYCRQKEAGNRSKVNQAANDFVTEFTRMPNTGFIISLCESVEHKLNHLIWRGIVFPFVKIEMENNPAAIKCLIQTIQNLYSDRTAHAEFGWVTEDQLTIKYLSICPTDKLAIARRRGQLSSWLAYTIHEWPSGVLYGKDGATILECDEILAAVDELKAVDSDKKYKALCEEVIEKTTLYRNRLANMAACQYEEAQGNPLC